MTDSKENFQMRSGEWKGLGMFPLFVVNHKPQVMSKIQRGFWGKNRSLSPKLSWTCIVHCCTHCLHPWPKLVTFIICWIIANISVVLKIRYSFDCIFVRFTWFRRTWFGFPVNKSCNYGYGMSASLDQANPSVHFIILLSIYQWFW